MDRRSLLKLLPTGIAALVGAKLGPAELGPAAPKIPKIVQTSTVQRGYLDDALAGRAMPNFDGSKTFVYGVAPRDIKAGELAYVQVSGPAKIRLAE